MSNKKVCWRCRHYFADCPHRGFYRIFGRQQPSGHQPLAHSSIHDFKHLCRGYFRRNACQETSGYIQQGCRRQQPDAHALDLRAGWLVCRISQGDGSR